jgi:hypothetical protein
MSHATAPSTASPAPTTAATKASVTAELKSKTGRNITVVATTSGYEAAAFDQTGHIDIWSYTGSWHRSAQSTYPYTKGIGAVDASVIGAVLNGMAHATFALTGTLTGDGSGSAVAYSDGAKGWGVLLAEDDGNLASTGSGLPQPGPGVEYAITLAGGVLHTSSGATIFDIAHDGEFPIERTWRWSGNDFALAADNIVTATKTGAVAFKAPSLPGTATIPDGTYGAVLASLGPDGDDITATASGETITCAGEGSGCIVGSGVQRTVSFDPGTALTYTAVCGPTACTITGSAWLMLAATINPSHPLAPAMFAKRGTSPYYLPSSLGVTSMQLYDAGLALLSYQGGVVVRVDHLSTP